MALPNEANVFRFTQGFFGTSLDGAVAQQVTAGLAATQGVLHTAGAIWLFATVYLALGQNLSFGRFMTRILRVLMVTTIVAHPALYNQFVVQPVLNGIPNQLVQAFGGPLGAENIPDQFSAIYTAIEHMSAQLRSQANGWLQMADRFNISMAEFACKLLLVPQYGLWFCLHAFQALLVVAGTVAIIFWMFDKTQGYAEAWAGKIVGSLVATMLMSVTLQIIFLMNAAYMVPAGNLPMGADGKSFNITEGLDQLFDIAVVFFLGIFFMIISVIIGFGIGRATGFDAGAMVRTITRGANAAAPGKK